MQSVNPVQMPQEAPSKDGRTDTRIAGGITIFMHIDLIMINHFSWKSGFGIYAKCISSSDATGSAIKGWADRHTDSRWNNPATNVYEIRGHSLFVGL